MNTSQIKTFAIQSRSTLKAGVLNRILTLGFNEKGALTVDRPIKIQGGTVFMGQLREEGFYDAWTALETKLNKHGIKDVCEEAAYTWFNRLVAIRIMQKNHFIEPVMQYVSQESRIPVIVDQARSGRLSLKMSAQDKAKLDELLRDSTKTNEQFNLLISAFCLSNPVIFKCFGGIEKHIALLLPDNILSQGGFIDMLNNTPYLTDEDYSKSELIGWLYQFYISEKKDEVFAKKGKYTPDEIPAATQIFTPNWIVKYMAENTIGRIYLDNNPYADEIKASMKYLVEPAEPTPKDAILKLNDLTEYKMIDNACGSGHILIEGFNLFYRMYMYEGYATHTAIENILTKNIIGIDLDTRAKQLATFALLMTAARLDKSFLDCKVMPRVLDFPEPFSYTGGTWEDFFPHYYLGGSKKVIDETIKAFELMKQAESLGSIMKFEISDETRAAMEKSTAEWEKQEFLNGEIAEAIKTMKVILALTDKYSAACMNPPYMGNHSMDDSLKSYVDSNYPVLANDLGSVFIQVALNMTRGLGIVGMINQATWLFKPAYSLFREAIINDEFGTFQTLLYLGPATFEEIKGEVVQSVCFTLKNHPKSGETICYYLKKYKTSKEKEKNLLLGKAPRYKRDIHCFSAFSDNQFGFWIDQAVMSKIGGSTLSDIGDAKQGIKTGNNPYFIKLWHEIGMNSFKRKWFPVETGGDYRKWYGNQFAVLNWENDGEEIRNFKDEQGHLRSRPQNIQYFFTPGLTWSTSAGERPSFRFSPDSFTFESSGSKFFIKGNNISDLCYYMAFLNSYVAKSMIEVFSPGIGISEGAIKKLPYINDEKSPDILKFANQNVEIAQSDWDSHEISWGFRINELVRFYNGENSDAGLFVNANRLEDIVELFKEYWTGKFNQLHANEEEINRQFIEDYGLCEELVPDVPLTEVTILQNGEISIVDNKIVWHDDVLIKQLISYAVGCWMGRYRLDKEGLYIAHYPKDEEICTYDVNGYKFEIDDDAIIPLMGKDNPFEDDNALQKCINFLKFVFGGDTFLTKNMNYVEHCLGKSLESYLIKDFWKDHKKMYQNRPIYWLFSSKKGAFQVLTYMHRMNPYTVEKIRTKYLLPYIKYLEGRIEVDEARGSGLSAIERANLIKMKTALEECKEYHDRLHEVAIQNIDFDLDDGVVVNYAKFGDVVAKIK